MKTFRLVADIEFEAENASDAAKRIADHFGFCWCCDVRCSA